MARGEDRKTLERGLMAALEVGGVTVPMLLLRLYKRMNLSDTEAMLLVHLIAYREKEGKEFPTLEELQERMSAPPETVIKALQRLLKDEFLEIDDDIDQSTGVLSENYNLTLMYRKLAEAWFEETVERQKPNIPARGAVMPAKADTDNIFTIFEKEFARPLTPMECENISQWLDRDRYPEELILLALKEAVFAGVIHFRYIDRILLEWSRNRVQTPEQARQYTQKFRGAR
ncbi:DnaD domain protein [Paenibacillus ginsengarvi]|uniref:DnaD domain protein n=1 Tax=Paenibacillus ginsengarvi TaxID=400777 RepID=A0A3B0BLF2_9BACL|nr:DnaD domain protein [Paenibacillus ginsengarvi]RKN72426.1 DnaD domain protein [Paenibacillus ginsengarvi]